MSLVIPAHARPAILRICREVHRADKVEGDTRGNEVS